MKSKFGGRMLECLLYIAAADVGTILLKLLFLVIVAPLTDEIASRGSAGAPLQTVYNVIYVLFYVGIMLFILWKNPVRKGEYLRASFESGYSLKFSAAYSFGRLLPAGAAAAAVFSLPLHLVLQIFGEIIVVPMLFTPLFALYELAGNIWLSYALNTLLPPLIFALFTPLVHLTWDRNRLRG